MARLRRENEEFAIQSKKNNTGRDEELEKEKNRFDEKRAELQIQLKEELAMRKKHEEEIANIVNVRILDEVEKMRRTHDERIAGLKEQLAETIASTEGQSSALDMIDAAYNDIANSLDDVNDKTNLLGMASTSAASKASSAWATAGQNMRTSIASVLTQYGEAFSAMIGMTPVTPRLQTNIFLRGAASFQEFIQGLTGFKPYEGKTGGVVPGAVDQPVPVIAHGGETILTANVSPLTVNINNPTVRDEQDINKIANAVEQVLSRRQFLRHIQ